MEKTKRLEKAEALGIKRYCAGRARKATGLLKEFYDEHDIQTSATDCLADIMHLCEVKGWSFVDALESAYMHYGAEAQGGEHG